MTYSPILNPHPVTDGPVSTAVGATNETAPATDTATSGLNGRLQRIAQRLTSLIALVPASLGQKTMANSLAVTVASDQSAVPISDNSGSLTVDAPVATPVFVRTSNGSAAIDPGFTAQLPGTLGIKTAANSVSFTHASDDALVTATGAPADASATSDTGTFSLIALFKRALGYLSTIATAASDTVTPSPVKIDQTTPGTTDAVTVKTPADVINYVPTLDTAAYAAGDVLAATAVISNVMRVNDGRAILFSLTGIDKSKQKPAMTILFYQTNVTSAAANAANSLSDADQLNLLGFHRIVAADWIDYANNSICCFKGATAPQLLLEAAAGTKDVYAVCILDAGTPTFAVGDLMFKLGVVQA